MHSIFCFVMANGLFMLFIQYILGPTKIFQIHKAIREIRQ